MPLNDSWQKLKHVTKKKKTTDDVSRPTEGGTQLISATPDRSIFLGGGVIPSIHETPVWTQTNLWRF